MLTETTARAASGCWLLCSKTSAVTQDFVAKCRQFNALKTIRWSRPLSIRLASAACWWWPVAHRSGEPCWAETLALLLLQTTGPGSWSTDACAMWRSFCSAAQAYARWQLCLCQLKNVLKASRVSLFKYKAFGFALETGCMPMKTAWSSCRRRHSKMSRPNQQGLCKACRPPARTSSWQICV